MNPRSGSSIDLFRNSTLSTGGVDPDDIVPSLGKSIVAVGGSPSNKKMTAEDKQDKANRSSCNPIALYFKARLFCKVHISLQKCIV